MLRAPASFYPLVNRGVLEALLCFVFLYFVLAGPGPWSLDETYLKRRRSSVFGRR